MFSVFLFQYRFCHLCFLGRLVIFAIILLLFHYYDHHRIWWCCSRYKLILYTTEYFTKYTTKKLNCGLFEKFVINFSSQISMLNALNIFFTHFYMHVSKRKLNMWLEFSYINVLYKLCCNPDQKHFFVLMKD